MRLTVWLLLAWTEASFSKNPSNAGTFLGQSKLEVIGSPGCGKDVKAHDVSELHLQHGGLWRTYKMLLPSDYHPGSPRAVIMGFHGHGMSNDEIIDVFRPLLSSEPDAPIIVAPRGVFAPGLPASFNGAGSTGSPGPDGPTCVEGAAEYTCHIQTCGICQKCWWTSCADDVGYALAVLDHVKAELCVNPDQVYATGFSGGGQFTFEIATNARSASFFEAVAPLSGLPHNGFVKAPDPKIAPRFLGMWEGANAQLQDPAYPPISNVQGRPDKSLDTCYGPNGGFYYSTAANTTAVWAEAMCSSSIDDAATASAALAQSPHAQISCHAWCGGQVIKCLRASDLHDWRSYQPRLLWDFFQGKGHFNAGFSQSLHRRSRSVF